MEASGGGSDVYGDSSYASSSNYNRRYGVQNLSASNFFRSPLSALLEYSGILRTRSTHPESDSLIDNGISLGLRDQIHTNSVAAGNVGEVSIRIIDTGEQENERVRTVLSSSSSSTVGQLRESSAANEMFIHPIARTASSSALDGQGDSRSDHGVGGGVPHSPNGAVDTEAGDGGVGVNTRDSSYQRYDIQQATRWIDQVLPFTLLLLVIFIRQHWQGFSVTIWIAAVMFKSNDILRKQTALKGERKTSVLVGISIVFMLHVVGVYWWYRSDDLLYPLVMLPPTAIPPFWHAIFIIMVNGSSRSQAWILASIINRLN